ncbi:MAG: iron-containing alcohol dehydrogenase [Clostridia bacterium]|nr:iron-containing alcohol dehydrogenase [Clostridia bacterium]
MMRPIKMAGDELIFGEGCLSHLETLKKERAVIITSGSIFRENGVMDKVTAHLDKVNIKWKIFEDVEPDPHFETVIKGAKLMQEFCPDVIIALGGGSAMDAAKGMWIYYEHPELKNLSDIEVSENFPRLRNKAIMVCIPTTAGTASEVSRSIVISDEKGVKHGIGNMEMMPDIAICDPVVTLSMPKKITAETGMDALTHALEALVSKRAHFLSDILAKSAIKDIIEFLPKAFEEGQNILYREKMLNASTIAGIAFTNVSLGIIHSMAHTLGSYFKIPHGLCNAILLPYIVKFNMKEDYAKKIYKNMAKELSGEDMVEIIKDLNEKVQIPKSISEIIEDRELYMSRLCEMAEMAKKDGCTKTNPIIPTIEEFKELFIEVYGG